MAKSQYSADSASPPPLSMHPGMPGSRKGDPVKFVSCAALPAHDASVPATYVLVGGASTYFGDSAHPSREMPKPGAFRQTSGLNAAFPATTSIG